MRVLFFLIGFTLATVSVFGQKVFEGTLTYSYKIEGPRMEYASRYYPTGYIYKIKEGNLRFSVEGGRQIFGDILMKEGKKYMLKEDEKVAYLMPSEASDKTKGMTQGDTKAEGITAEVFKEDEVVEFLGYRCQKYRIETKGPDGSVTELVWVTDELTMPKIEGMDMVSNLEQKGITGFPMKRILVEVGGLVSKIMEIREISFDAVPDSDFSWPADYTEKPFDPSSFKPNGY